MPCTLIVAEKPSVARDIARVLGCKERGEGVLSGGRLPGGEACRVTWAIGHLVTLMEPEELDPRYKRWNAADLPILPADMKRKVLPKTKAQFAVIRSLLRSRDVADVVCATDAGREGELIFRYIYEMAGCAKPVRRLWISSMTDEAVREGFARLKPGSDYDSLYESARCRSEADWLVGMNASRAFTLRYGALLSVGRVQTPTLEMLVRRRAEIEVFEAKPYWLVQAGFGDYTGLWFDQASGGDARGIHRITDEAAAAQIAGRVRGRSARVEQAAREEKRDLPPQLFDLTSLQREANQKLGFTAQRTLSVAQSLYEKHKLITYPRTDSRHLPKDMLTKTRQALDALGELYAPWTGPLLAGKLPMSSRVFDDAKVSDHHAILPTPKRANALPADEGKLYALIARRTVAAFLPPYVYDAVRVITAVDRDGSAPDFFLSQGRVERETGWKALYRALEAKTENPQAKSAKTKPPEDQEQALPALAVGDIRLVERADLKQASTKPPPPHTDASLLYAMEHAGREIEDVEMRERLKAHGLGTPATRAAILERLIAVGYAERRGKQLWATDKGVGLIAVAPADIASPETTGRWEKGLDDIAHRAASPERFLEGIRRLCERLVRYAADQAPDAAFAPEPRNGPKEKPATRAKTAAHTLPIRCPLCGEGSLSENSKAFGCSRWKQGCSFTLWKDTALRQGGPALTEALVLALLQKGSVRGSTGTLRWKDNRILFETSATLRR